MGYYMCCGYGMWGCYMTCRYVVCQGITCVAGMGHVGCYKCCRHVVCVEVLHVLQACSVGVLHVL